MLVACEQALLFGRVKRVSRERASGRRSREGPRPLTRLASLAQIGELARRLNVGNVFLKDCIEVEKKEKKIVVLCSRPP